jgi:signal transduction histidine kinase/CheY-like chemotaxis protein
VQLELENDLQKTVINNNAVSARVQYLSQWLIVLAIGAIVVMATIIIRHLLKNFKLIQDLETAREKANKAANIKEQFLANMSHEIRTPINSVIGFTQLLQKTNLTKEQQQFVNLINTSGNNLLNIINDILDISKLEANMLALNKKPFSIRELCYSLEMMFAHKAKENGITYTSQVYKEIPELLLGDKERLNQILTNLIANAFKFTHEGEVRLSVQAVATTGSNTTIRFVVKDTGIGIEPSTLARIFERFEQADADTTRQYGGTGLGLAIVKNIITMHGGTINVNSETGKGSAFIFEITYPIYFKDSNDAMAVPPSHHALVKNSLKGARVLAAEDNKMNQTLLKFLFKQWDIDYTLAETGQQAIDRLKEKDYDLLLLDIQMPVMDGYTSARFIREQLLSDIPIIAMTAHVLPGEKEKCLNSGMDSYISKPLDEEELFQLIKKHIVTLHQPTQPLTTEVAYVDIHYLQQTYAHNQAFINTVLVQFSQQYQEELTALQAAIGNKDFVQVKKWAHHMKTTVTAIHIKSPLYPHLANIEKTPPDAVVWNTIEEELSFLESSKDKVLQQIDGLCEKATT